MSKKENLFESYKRNLNEEDYIETTVSFLDSRKNLEKYIDLIANVEPAIEENTVLSQYNILAYPTTMKGNLIMQYDFTYKCPNIGFSIDLYDILKSLNLTEYESDIRFETVNGFFRRLKPEDKNKIDEVVNSICNEIVKTVQSLGDYYIINFNSGRQYFMNKPHNGEIAIIVSLDTTKL